VSSPHISIIVPVLNTRPYLVECLDSLAAQTLSDIEIICVDNGSQDGSYELLLDYSTREPRMVVLRHEQGRQGGARNAGIKVAQGEYLGFVDADDWADAGMFERLLKAAHSSNADVAICNAAAVFSGLRESRATLIPSALLNGEGAFDITQRPRLLRSLVVWNKLFRHSFIRRCGIAFPDGVYHEDQYFAAAAMTLAERICGLSQVLYFYRQDRQPRVGRDRTRDHEHVFAVYELLEAFISSSARGASRCQLINELAVVRFLNLAGQGHGGCTRAYFGRMRQELRQRHVRRHSPILTPTEQREYHMVCRCNYVGYRMYVLLRGVYSMWRRLRLADGRAGGGGKP